jgi:hypothetical protein
LFDGACCSYLTGLTGLSAELVDAGVTLAEATKALQDALPKNAVLVGQGILKGEWLLAACSCSCRKV